MKVKMILRRVGNLQVSDDEWVAIPECKTIELDLPVDVFESHEPMVSPWFFVGFEKIE